VLSAAVSGFGRQDVHHDYLWRKQRRGGRVAVARLAPVASNVQELFPDKS
jgi:hypothetical protein